MGSISKQSKGQTIVNINEVLRCKNESDMPPCPEEVPGCGRGSNVKDILIHEVRKKEACGRCRQCGRGRSELHAVQVLGEGF